MKVADQLFRVLGFNTQGDLGPWTFYTSRRKGLVWFIKAPPLEPPSQLQTTQRNRFRAVGTAWAAITAEMRANWELAAKKAHLKLTGFNLFTYWILTNDDPAIQTIERQTGLQLIPLKWETS